MDVNGVVSVFTSDAVMMLLGALISLSVMEACFRGAMALAQRRARRKAWAQRRAEAEKALAEARAARQRVEASRQRTAEILTRSAQVLGKPELTELYQPPAEDNSNTQ